MITIRTKIARRLKTLADKIEKQDENTDDNTQGEYAFSSSSEIPIEFRTTKELAEIIRDRNDQCILCWGKEMHKDDEGHYALDGEYLWRARDSALPYIFSDMMSKILGISIDEFPNENEDSDEDFNIDQEF